MNRLQLSGVAMVVVAVGLLSACGDDEDSEGDFTAEADAICQEQAQSINDLFTAEGNPANAADLTALLEKRIPLDEEFVAELQELDPPEDVSADYEAFVAEIESRTELLREQQQAASQGDEARVREIDTELAKGQTPLDEQAAEIGFEACANQLPEDEQEEVRAVLEDITTTGDPAHCTEDYTEIFVEGIGGLEECERGESDQAAQADSTEISEIHGVSQTSASAHVTFTGGANDGKTVEHFLVYQDGRWKLDGVGPPIPEG